MASLHTGPNRDDKRYIKTEKLIREAFYKLLGMVDLDKITVAAIAREADINRKTFYLHYESVDALIRQVAEEQAVRFAKKLSQEAQGTGTGGILLGLESDIACDMEDARNVASRVSLQQMISYLERPLVDALLTNDKSGLADKTESTSYLATFLVAGLLAVYRRWLVEGSDMSLEDLVAVERTAVSSLLSSYKERV